MKATHEIKQLINLFYEGQTTVEQENELKAYFAQPNIAEELIDEQEIFNSIFDNDLETDIKIPDELEQKIIETIDLLEPKEKIISIKKRAIIFLPIAAVITILFSFSLLFLNNKPTPQTLSQAEKQDLIKAQQALILLSEKYNKGIEQVAQTQYKLSESNEMLHKSLKTVIN